MASTTSIKTRKKSRKESVRTDEPFYSAENMRAIDRSIRQLREGKVVVKTMDELKAMEE